VQVLGTEMWYWDIVGWLGGLGVRVYIGIFYSSYKVFENFQFKTFENIWSF
jgi:hypothetical protein